MNISDSFPNSIFLLVSQGHPISQTMDWESLIIYYPRWPVFVFYLFIFNPILAGKESIRKSSNWAVDHNQYDPDQIIRMIYDHVMQANAYNQKIIFLYLYDDILSTSNHHEAAYDFAKDLKRSMEPTLSTLFSDIYHSTSEKKEQSLLFDILNHWRKKH